MHRILPKKINSLVNQIFPEQDLKHKYKVKKIIGKGQYGYVAKAVQKKNNQFVAIKKLINVFQNQFQTKRILRQMILLRNCNHPNIVSLIQVLIPHNQTLQNFDTIYIVTEYCDTDLKKLFKMEETFLGIQDVKFILYQIVCGLKYLHSASIIHRDLTPSNILVNGQGMKVKICDLGLARVVQKKQTQKQEGKISDQQSLLQSQINNLTLQEKQAINKQILCSFQNIDAESLPSTPNVQYSSIYSDLNNNEEFLMKGAHTNKSIKIQIQPEQDLECGENHYDMRGSHKTDFQSDRKKKKLNRMGTKRISDSNFYQGIQKSAGVKIVDFYVQTIKKQQKKKLLSSSLAKLTLRVTTRWYRAPQVILLEKRYSRPIDIWSLGCLFGQLLKMMKSVCYNSLQRFPLFPGKHCYPVSPATLCDISRQASVDLNSANLKNDQLFMILSTIGKPSDQQVDFLTDQTAKDYIQSLDNFQRKQFKKFFPSVPKEAIQILENTLLFNPNQRFTIQQIINHQFLQDVRNQTFQIQPPAIKMEFQEQDNITLEVLRKYLTNQIKKYL